MLTEGTNNKTPVELEEAIDELGARINVYAGKESMTLTASCLVSKLDQVIELSREILFEPRWDEKEFKRLKSQTIESIKRSKINPASVASSVLSKLVYGHDHKLAVSSRGTVESVQSLTIDDLKSWYETNLSARAATIAVAGDISRDKAVDKLGAFAEWEATEIRYPELAAVEDVGETRVYFIDFPGARQSQIRAGHVSIPATHPDYYKLSVMNHKLGGSFNSVLNMILREEKGWTYGARSSFSGSFHPGMFSASSGVQAKFTLESLEIVRDAIMDYRTGISREDLGFTKDALIKSNARRFETLGGLMGMLYQITVYERPDDYVKQREKTVKDMTLEQHKKLAQTYLKPDHMIYLAAGDADAHLENLKKLGYGTPILLDRDGNPVK